MTAYVTNYPGTVHRADCPIAQRSECWAWSPTNDGPGVNTACKTCLGGVMPVGER